MTYEITFTKTRGVRHEFVSEVTRTTKTAYARWPERHQSYGELVSDNGGNMRSTPRVVVYQRGDRYTTISEQEVGWSS